MQNFKESGEFSVCKAFILMMTGKNENVNLLLSHLPNDPEPKVAMELSIAISDGFDDEALKKIGNSSYEEARKIRYEIIGEKSFKKETLEQAAKKSHGSIFHVIYMRRLKNAVIKNDMSEDQLKEIRECLKVGIDYKTILQMVNNKVSSSRMEQIREIFMVRNKTKFKEKI